MAGRGESQGASQRADPPLAAVGRLAGARFMTVAEVAEVMRVSRMTVYRMVHDQTIASVRVGRSFRVPESAVHDYLEAAYTEAG